MRNTLHVLGWVILALLLVALLGMVYIAVGLAGTLLIVGISGAFSGLFFLGMWLISR